MILIGILTLAIGAAILVQTLTADVGRPRRLLPPEMEGAKLLFVEQTLFRAGPVTLRGRPDEVWKHDGQLVIIETKKRGGPRPRVYPSDRAQIDSYGYLVRGRPEARRHPVAPHAWVRFVGGKTPTFVRVPVAPDEVTIERHRRLHELRKGAAARRGKASRALCRGCGHRDVCPEMKGKAA